MQGTNLEGAEFLRTEIFPNTNFRNAKGVAAIKAFETIKLDHLGTTPPKFIDTSAEGSGGILSFFRSVLGSVCADASAAAEEAAEDAAPVSSETLDLFEDLTGTARSKAKAAEVERPMKWKDPARVLQAKAAFEQVKDSEAMSTRLREQLLARQTRYDLSNGFKFSSRSSL